MTLENEKLIDLATNGLELSNKINDLNDRINILQRDLRA